MASVGWLTPATGTKRSRPFDNDYERPTKGPRRVQSGATHLHPDIGEIQANNSHEAVRQFLGLQYATLKDRFAPAQLRQYTGDEYIDATNTGPQVVHIPNGPDVEQGLIQQTIPYDPTELTSSDLEGLNLNVTVPLAADGTIKKDRKLPVFFYIHGGGFGSGSAAWPQYNLARFVSSSQEKGKPCIGIAINYRLGAPGLLNSEELRSRGYKANNSLLDQRMALKWVRKYIAGFGGDSDNVTIAGPVSCCFHLQSSEPLFKRVIITSVTSLQMRPMSEDSAEQSYETALRALGLDATERQERVEQLLTMDSQKLRTGLGGARLAPIADEVLPLQGHTFAEVTSGKASFGARQWCQSVMIGDCQFDASIFGLKLLGRKAGIADAFRRSIRSSLSYKSHVAEKLLSAYSLTEGVSDDDALEGILQVASDIAFYAPTVSFAEGLHGDIKMFLYRFNEPNPWSGTWKGRATHALDVALLLQNFREHLEGPQRSLAEELADDIFSFVGGSEPWPAWRCDNKIAKVYGPGGTCAVVEDEPAKVGRRNTIWELATETDLDTLFFALMGFVAQKGPPKAAQKKLTPVTSTPKAVISTQIQQLEKARQISVQPVNEAEGVLKQVDGTDSLALNLRNRLIEVLMDELQKTKRAGFAEEERQRESEAKQREIQAEAERIRKVLARIREEKLQLV